MAVYIDHISCENKIERTDGFFKSCVKKIYLVLCKFFDNCYNDFSQ